VVVAVEAKGGSFCFYAVQESYIQTLGVRGHLPSRPIVSSLWVLKQFAPTLPGGSMLGTF